MLTCRGDAGSEEQPEELATKELQAEAAEVAEVLDVCPAFDSFDTLVLDVWPGFASFDTELRELWKVSLEPWWWWLWESFEIRGGGEAKTEKSTSTSITCSATLECEAHPFLLSVKTFSSQNSHLSLVPLHLLEDGEVEVDLLHPGILLLESKREEEFSIVSRPELTELELLLNFP